MGAPEIEEQAPEGAGIEADADPVIGGEQRAAVADIGPVEMAEDPRAVPFLTGFTGRVVTWRGTPVGGVTVKIVRIAPDAMFQQGPGSAGIWSTKPLEVEAVAGQDRTAEDGVFLIDGVLPRGIYVLRMDFEDISEVPLDTLCGQGTWRPITNTPRPGELLDMGDVELVQKGVLTGRVVGPEGEGLGGVLVRALPAPSFVFQAAPIERITPDTAFAVMAGGFELVAEMPAAAERLFELAPWARTRTLPDGTFRLGGVETGSVAVAAYQPGLTSKLLTDVELKPGEIKALEPMRLGEGEWARVVVKDSAGEPIQGAEVRVGPGTLGGMGPPVAFLEDAGETNAEGWVEHGGLPARTKVLAAARRSPRDSWVLAGPESPDIDIEIELAGGASLLVHVKDEAGNTIKKPDLRLMSSDQAGAAAALLIMGAAQPIDIRGRTETTEEGLIKIEDLESGGYTVFARAPGFGTTSGEVQVGEAAEGEEGGSGQALELVLPAARSVTVVALTPEGEPMQGAEVYAFAAGGPRRNRPVDIPTECGRTDEEGRLRVDEFGTPEVQLTCEHPAYGQIHSGRVPLDGQEVVMQFEAPGSITGILTEGLQPPAPGRWVVLMERRKQMGQGGLFEMPSTRVPDLQGGFRFEGLQPGEYRLTAQDSFDELTTMKAMFDFGRRMREVRPYERETVTVYSGQDTAVRIDALNDLDAYDGPGAAIRGTVLVNGVPAEGAAVVAVGRRPDASDDDGKPDTVNQVAKVTEAGYFELPKMPVGKVDLRVVSKDAVANRVMDVFRQALYRQSVEVVDGVEQNLSIRIDSGGVDGVVMSSYGSPIAGADVEARLLQEEGEPASAGTAKTDVDGRFQLRDLSVGEYQIFARSEAGQVLVDDVRIVAGAVAGPVVVNLEPFVAVRGTIDWRALSEERPQRMFVFMRPEGDPSPDFRRDRQRQRQQRSRQRGRPMFGFVDDQGAFSITNAIAGRYTLQVRWGRGETFDVPQAVVVTDRDVEGLQVVLPGK